MVGFFYASQIGPLNMQQWHSDRDKFLQAMEANKDCEWLNIKELEPICYMRYVAKCFQDTTGHDLQGLGLHMRWIRAQSYYHWKVAELNQLQHCPHLRGLPVPPGPMEHPSALSQPHRLNRPVTTAPGTTGSSKVRGQTTSDNSDEAPWREGEVGDGASWDDLVTHAEAASGACKKRKLMQGSKHPATHFPLHLRRSGRKRWALSMNM